MQLLTLIGIVLLAGFQYVSHELSYGFAGCLTPGAALRPRKVLLVVSIAATIGFFLFGETAYEQHSATLANGSVALALTLSLSIFLTLLAFKRFCPLPSACYAFAGSVWSWQLFNNQLQAHNVIPTLCVWISAPLLGALVSAILFLCLHRLVRRQRYHLLQVSVGLRIGIILAILMTGMAVGANNGPLFLSILSTFKPDFGLDFGLFTLTGRHLLWLVALPVLGMATILLRTRIKACRSGFPETNMGIVFVVLLSQAAVLFLFGSETFCGLFGLDPTAVSPIHIMLGAMAGIGLIRHQWQTGLSNLAQAGFTMVAVPLLSFGICQVLLHWIGSAHLTDDHTSRMGPTALIDVSQPALLILFVLFLWFIRLKFQSQHDQRIRTQNVLKNEQHQHLKAQQVLTAMELKTIQLENDHLNHKIEIKRKELINLALNISEQRIFFEGLNREIKQIQALRQTEEMKERLEQLLQTINGRMSFSNEMNGFYSQVDELHKNFLNKLAERFPELTEQEKRLATLLRLGFSSKDIAGLVNISPKSVEISRYRLRKKLGLNRKDNLIQFIKSL